MKCGASLVCSFQAFAVLGFMASAVLISAAASEVVSVLHMLGVVLSLSNTVLGLTLLAWGNSIGGDTATSPYSTFHSTDPRPWINPCSSLWQTASLTSPLPSRGTHRWRYLPASEASFSVSLFLSK